MHAIVLAADGSTYSDAAALFVATGKLLKRPLIVHLVHCMADVLGEVKSYISATDLAAWHADESSRILRSAAEIVNLGGVSFEQHALTGFAPERIVEFARSVDASAIDVMGTHGRGAFFDAIVGSVAGRVIAHAPCPVILVKREAVRGR
ncbi:MAG: universal stress protein UspA [Cupriavidus sp.]|jgi:nucleotide-binding universal stress UspA family protein|uniref:universal stress protein n=1 Tax=Cupriavidus TaxID=106589 RepID=UPI000C4F42BF|nr:universal stress protein [Cupriavidus pauculus]MBU67876.1 universal stress protein UspA [Cupriavidus sp.]MCM3609492.1 universal stress protein [Cupriavidus pauculus]